MTAHALRSSRAKSRGARGAPRSTPLDFARDERVFVIAAISFLLTAAAPQTAVDAERAFAADAQSEGQWTAFRKWAAPDAIMFLPQPTRIHEWLKDKPDPPVSFMWWPAEAYVSCDGNTAVTTGPAVRGTYRGYFTTVWQKQADGDWKWLLDHGDELTKPRPSGETVPVRKASCKPLPKPDRRLVPVYWFADASSETSTGQSADGSLTWSSTARSDGIRTVEVRLWNGTVYETAIKDEVAAPAR